jgi:hypothetical protein
MHPIRWEIYLIILPKIHLNFTWNIMSKINNKTKIYILGLPIYNQFSTVIITSKQFRASHICTVVFINIIPTIL